MARSGRSFPLHVLIIKQRAGGGSTPSDNDTGAGADTATVAAAVSAADTAAGADTAALGIAAADTATGADTAAIAAAVSDGDTGAGADIGGVPESLSDGDTGIGADYAVALPPLNTPAAAIFPQVIVECGFAPTDPALGSLDLILDSGSQGLLGTDELADIDTWTDISAYVQQGHTDRLTTRQQGPLTVFQGGNATFTLNNADGRFDPQNLSGPYVTGGVTQIRPMIPVRVRVTWAGVTYYVWQGFAISWIPPAENFGPVYDQTVLTAGDGFRVFANVTTAASGPVGAGEATGTRINRILAAAGWYSGARGMSVLATGNSTVQAYGGNDTALNLLQACADSEVGELYCDAQGRVVFRQRTDILEETRSNTAQGVFGGSPGTPHISGWELEATLLSRPDDDTTMANDIQAQIVGSSNQQEVKDATSIATYLFPRTYQRTDLILQTDADALSWAEYVLYLAKDDEFRFDQVTITPGVDSANLYPQVLGRDLGDRIEVWKRPPNVPGYSKDLFIRGITHDWTPLFWQTTWGTQNAARYSFLTLDNEALGVLDSNALAW
jgi:hypothetical protein